MGEFMCVGLCDIARSRSFRVRDLNVSDVRIGWKKKKEKRKKNNKIMIKRKIERKKNIGKITKKTKDKAVKK